ncbi:hypothetical protein B0H10DRAFT_2232890 [Mycena sp. CBHHK59/15]|nr:hypothetical protein B0H10DRAFT_2232890 [Mycena sp. CBHHK59/15]
MYHSLCSPRYNEDTIRRIKEDPECQIILATITFSNGINAKSLLNSVFLGFSGTLDIVWQEKGCAGRKSGTLARGVVLIQKSTITAARKLLKSVSASIDPKPKKGKGSRTKKTSQPMSLVKANFILETNCYIAHYANPPLETFSLDCLTAKRPLPCSLCLSRSSRTLDFPAPQSAPILPTLRSKSKSKPVPVAKKLKLVAHEREAAKIPLRNFRKSLRLQEHKQGKFIEHPETMFLPSTFQNVLLDKMLSISSLSDLYSHTSTWCHREDHSAALYHVILTIKDDIMEDRRIAEAAVLKAATKQKRLKKRKAAEMEDSTDKEVDKSDVEGDESDSSLPERIELPPKSTRSRNPRSFASSATRKRAALDTVTNLPQAWRARAPQVTAAEAAKEYSRQYKPRQRSS